MAVYQGVHHTLIRPGFKLYDIDNWPPLTGHFNISLQLIHVKLAHQGYMDASDAIIRF